jgi:hypothetical protein
MSRRGHEMLIKYKSAGDLVTSIQIIFQIALIQRERVNFIPSILKTVVFQRASFSTFRRANEKASLFVSSLFVVIRL